MRSVDGPGASRAPESNRFRKIGERPKFSAGFFEVVSATFVGPDGFTFEREIIHHPGAVCIVPLEADRRHVLMIRQYRAAVERAILELPAGKRDVQDEAPELCASRELVEEIGRMASSFTEVARFYNSPGFCDELTICFLAEGLQECDRDAHGPEEQHLTIERIALDDVEELMAAGDLIDAKSIIGLIAARTFLRRPPQAAEATDSPEPADSPRPAQPADSREPADSPQPQLQPQPSAPQQ